MNNHRKSSTLSLNSSRNKPLPPIIIDSDNNNNLSVSSTPILKPQNLVLQNPRAASNIDLSQTSLSSPSYPADSTIFQPKTLKRRNLKKLTLNDNQQQLTNASNDIVTPLTSSSSKTSEDLELAENFEKLSTSINKSLHIRRKDILTLKNLGEGQSGVVSQVLHVPTNKMMAKKQILFEKNIKIQNQILRELKILNEVQSPYIIEFYGAIFIDSSNPQDDEDTIDSSTLKKRKSISSASSPIKMLHNNKSVEELPPTINSNGVLIFMEYMDCGSLDYILKKLGFLKEVYLSKITHNILQGLNYLYSTHKIIHRDIKPSNVLLNFKGEVKICDFGVSRELSNNSIADTFVGTSTYMSPERIQGDVYSIKGDVWSLGLMLIELSTGEFPFGKKDTPNGILDLLQRIVNEDPPCLPANKYSKELCEFVDLCLKKQKERPTPIELLKMPKSFVTKYEKEESGPLLRHLAKKIYKLDNNK